MSNSIARVERTVTVIVGVDTHKHVHVAVAIDRVGARLESCSVTADRAGYADLMDWARTLGAVEAFGIEGTGSYGVGLASFVRRKAVRVVEVNHCDRRKRRNNGKSDTIDAETAARSVLAGIATAIPKTADGASEMVRQIKIARDTAVKARSSAIITLKTLIVNAPGELRETLEPLTDRKLVGRCAELEPGQLLTPTASVKHALRALATRWLALSVEIGAHDQALDTITMTAAPSLRDAFGIGPDSAAEMLIVAGDNPERIRSDAAFAKLCGACPSLHPGRAAPTACQREALPLRRDCGKPASADRVARRATSAQASVKRGGGAGRTSVSPSWKVTGHFFRLHLRPQCPGRGHNRRIL